eukprot:CAMPEP_0167755778 /NCGR_PEP_ID=MMETSP0110_2-20121227/9014_1 /TAXON_ID=629695 /ORGANISM="Gymnochlora sp., Strain CCMP2014" /LENGTH=153 /DNA_ID=CAMNT_0007641805 /DNA_START=12 /DNA_END=473 /DNA_ORIENTATION=-
MAASRAIILAIFLSAAYGLQNLPGEPEDLYDSVEEATRNATDSATNCVDDNKLLQSLSGRKGITCKIALQMYQDQDASCHDDLGFGPLTKPCPLVCGVCQPDEKRRAVVVALEMIRAALTALTEEEQSQVMAGLWADAEQKGYTPEKLLADEL